MPEADHERWLTYAEAGQLLGILAAAARMLAKRRGWPRRTPNMYGDRARVLVPDGADVHSRAASIAVHTAHAITSDQSSPNGAEQVNVRVIEQAIMALSEALTAERARAAALQTDLAHMRVDLADVKSACAIHADSARSLQARLDRRDEWSFVRRLRWALHRR